MNPTQTQPAPSLTGSSQPSRLDRVSLFRYLREVPILASLNENGLDCLEDVEQVHVPRGEFIVHQGNPVNVFWILLTGTLHATLRGLGNLETIVATHPAGSAFGEVPLLAGIPSPISMQAAEPCLMLRLTEQEFWQLMTRCPEVRKAILGNMAMRLQKMQSATIQQEKMAALGTLAAGLMHELNNPGAAARRAANQLRENLLRLHELGARFTRKSLTDPQKECLLELQSHVLSTKPIQLNSLEQSDAEESLATWLDEAQIENAWKIAPTLVSVGIDAGELRCAHQFFEGTVFSDALNWLDALVSSMQLVGTIEESIGRVSTLVSAVKSYAYEGKGQSQKINVNESLYATLIILGHKLREKQIVLEKNLDQTLPPLETTCSGLNQVWTNILDNAIDAVPQHGHVRIRTWAEHEQDVSGDTAGPYLCVTIEDDGPGIPLESQPHIFEPFYTTKPAGVGTGLGLGIVQRIIEQFGGTIRFTSGPGSTLFRVRLPAQQPPLQPAS